MGIIENESRKRKRKQDIQKAILQTVAAAGLVSIGLLAPNIIKILGPALQKSMLFSGNVNRSRRKLVDTGYLKYNNNRMLELTPKGRAKLDQLELYNYKIKKPKKWDKRWRMLIFDIKEDRKILRDRVRRTLQTLGFYRLQDSVWVYPYDCEDLITLLKADFRIGNDLLYIIADSIENDKRLKNIFNL